MGRRGRVRAGRTAAVAALVVILGSGCIWDMGTLPGDRMATALDVNDAGLVVGTSMGDPGDQATWRPFRWADAGPLVELPLPGDAVWGEAVAVNAHGTILGKACGVGIDCRTITWDAAGHLSEVPAIGPSRPADINDAGVIVGSVPDDGSEWPFAWEPGDDAVTMLPIPEGSTYAYPEAVNADGTMAGNFNAGNGPHVVRWQLGSADIDLLGPGTAYDINAAGVIAGEVENSAATWAPGSTEPTVVEQRSVATAIADDGSFAGSDSLTTEAVVWRPGQPARPLGKLDGQTSYVTASSPDGKRVGIATTRGTWHAVRFFEPSTPSS